MSNRLKLERLCSEHFLFIFLWFMCAYLVTYCRKEVDIKSNQEYQRFDRADELFQVKVVFSDYTNAT